MFTVNGDEHIGKWFDVIPEGCIEYSFVRQCTSEELFMELDGSPVKTLLAELRVIGSNLIKIKTTRKLTNGEFEKLRHVLMVHVPRRPVPDVTPRQIRQALILYGVSTEQIENSFNYLPEPTKSLAKIEWEYSISFQRNRPLVNQIGRILGWTPQQIDELWIKAGSL